MESDVPVTHPQCLTVLNPMLYLHQEKLLELIVKLEIYFQMYYIYLNKNKEFEILKIFK